MGTDIAGIIEIRPISKELVPNSIKGSQKLTIGPFRYCYNCHKSEGDIFMISATYLCTECYNSLTDYSKKTIPYWMLLEIPPLYKAYNSYDILCGFMHYYHVEPMISPDRGLPKDCSPLTKRLIELKEEIIMTVSWIRSIEYLKYQLWETKFWDITLKKKIIPRDCWSFSECFNRMTHLGQLYGKDNVRLVFWFY